MRDVSYFSVWWFVIRCFGIPYGELNRSPVHIFSRLCEAKPVGIGPRGGWGGRFRPRCALPVLCPLPRSKHIAIAVQVGALHLGVASGAEQNSITTDMQ